MPNLFLVFVIFMLVLICLSCKNNSMSCILTHFQLINDLISAAVAGNDRSWLELQEVIKKRQEDCSDLLCLRVTRTRQLAGRLTKVATGQG